MKRWFSFGALAFVLVALPYSVFAQSNSANNEVKVASAHAVMAMHADSLTKTQTHLHHVINCLVGQNGAAFDPNAGNPCKGMGDGALADTKGNDKLHNQLEKALKAAQSGVKADSLNSASQSADKAAHLLSMAAKHKGDQHH